MDKIHKPVKAETTAHNCGTMQKEIFKIARISINIVVKVPMTVARPKTYKGFEGFDMNRVATGLSPLLASQPYSQKTAPSR